MKTSSQRIILLVMLFCGAVPSLVRAQAVTEPNSSTIINHNSAVDDYLIGPENSLELDIYYGKDQTITQKVRVSDQGDIICPLLGSIHAEGLTVSELQTKLTDLLGRDYLVNPQVNVFIIEYSDVSIVGEVKMPGAYPIRGRMTVLELISQAQGFTKIAAPNRVKIIRTNPDGSKTEISVRVYDIMNKNVDTNKDVLLQGGDVVVVPESIF